MKNNFWEEMNMTDRIIKSEVNEYHNKCVEKMNLPDWSNILCPHCQKQIEPSGIRKISCCFNARNLGDISIQFHCNSCSTMNTVYFREEVKKDINEFTEILNGNKKINSIPVVEEEMYKLRYNNLMERFIKEI